MSRNKKFFLIIFTTFSLCILAGQIFHYPNNIKDIASMEYPTDLKLSYPLSYSLFFPFFQFADLFSILSMHQHYILLIYILFFWIVFRYYVLKNLKFTQLLLFTEIKKFILALIIYIGGIAIIIIIPRPMVALKSTQPNNIILDFHSHTNYSWDARKSFSIQANQHWHKKAGFNAAFITDHNTAEGSILNFTNNVDINYFSLKGEEVSLYKSHWVVIGLDQTFSNQPYDNGMDGIQLFLETIRKKEHLFTIASLPEYWLYHWKKNIDLFSQWGLKGFEIVNSAPQALDFPVELRKQIINFCKKNNLVITGVSDNHGWGSTCFVWNVMEIQNWQKLKPFELEKTIIKTLNDKKFNSNRVITRIKFETTQNKIYLLFDPILQIIEITRSIPISQAGISLIWCWILFYWITRKNKKTTADEEPSK